MMAPGDDEEENEFLVRLPPWLFAGASAVIFTTIQLLEYPFSILFLWIFAAGVGFASTLLVRSTLVPSMLLWSRRDKLINLVSECRGATSLIGCPVCGNDKCARHGGEVSRLQSEPWEGVKVRKEIDKALSHFMELFIKNYVEFWYKEVSEDKHAEQLLRMAFRHVTAIFTQRMSKIDIAKLISGKFIKAAMYHMNMYASAKQKVGPDASQEELVDAVFREYGPRMHRALRGGVYAERQYMCRIADILMPYTLPDDVCNSGGMKMLLREIVGPGLLQIAVNTISDPDFINKMLIILVEPAVPVQELEAPNELVSMLDGSNRPLQPPSLMMASLQDIKVNTKLLLPFMNFLKARGLIGLLQFCLETGEFQDELDRATTDPRDMTLLLRKVRQIYLSYFATQSTDQLYAVDHATVQDLRAVCVAVEKGEVNLAFNLLIETMPIARAYSKIYGLLERDYVPLFLTSNEHLSLICGEKFPKPTRLRSVGNAKRLEPIKNLAKLGRRLKRHLRSSQPDMDNPMVTITNSDRTAGFMGSTDQEEVGDDVTQAHGYSDTIAEGDALDVEGPDAEGSGDEGVIVDKADAELSPAFVDDFSSWSITIAGVESRFSGKRSFYVYRIVSYDESDPNATREPIGRRFSEFFVLHRRLTQFHDDIDITLPVKKLLNLSRVTPKQTLQKSQQALENYLKQLVGHPSLKRSQALYNFLTNPGVVFEKKGIVNFRSVPRMLKRGHHLEEFMGTFLNSTFSPVPEHSADDLKKIQKEREGIDKVAEEFATNAAFEVPEEKQYWTQPLAESDVMSFDGLFDVIIYMMDNLFHPPRWLLVALFCGKIVGHKTLDAYLDTFLLGKVEILKADATVIDLIDLFRETIFEDEATERSEEQKQDRRKQAVSDLIKFFPGVVGAVLGKEAFHSGCKELVDILQSQKMNKLLAYPILDIAVEEFFPEVLTGSSSPA